MATFANTTSPTPFGFYDSDPAFQVEADGIVTFIKRKLGDDILSVELTKKQIWSSLEEAALAYSDIINQYQAQSQIIDLLGIPTGSFTSGSDNVGPHGSENLFPHGSFEYLMRKAEPYAQEAGLGGVYNTQSGSIALTKGQQDYDIYTELKDADGNTLFDNTGSNPNGGKMRIYEVFHFSPSAAYRFFDTSSAVNYLNNEFSFESFTPETVFYVLPVFEDILRGGQMDLSQRVRRSNYSYRITGTKIRLFPTPTADVATNLFIRVGFPNNPFGGAFNDQSVYGVSNLSNVPFGRIEYQAINSMGRQWIRQMALAIATYTLGRVRSKMSAIPIPTGDLTLDGSELVTEAREDIITLKTDLREMLDGMTYEKLIEKEADKVENLQRVLRGVPVPMGKAISMG
jgi:hypothetical protein